MHSNRVGVILMCDFKIALLLEVINHRNTIKLGQISVFGEQKLVLPLFHCVLKGFFLLMN